MAVATALTPSSGKSPRVPVNNYPAAYKIGPRRPPAHLVGGRHRDAPQRLTPQCSLTPHRATSQGAQPATRRYRCAALWGSFLTVLTFASDKLHLDDEVTRVTSCSGYYTSHHHHVPALLPRGATISFRFCAFTSAPTKTAATLSCSAATFSNLIRHHLR